MTEKKKTLEEGQLNRLLTQMRHGARWDVYRDVLDIYLNEETSEATRTVMRRAVRPVAVNFTSSAFGKNWTKLREGDPEEYVRLMLGKVSLCDGWPDPRDEAMTLSFIYQYAREHDIDLSPPMAAVKPISSHRIQVLFESGLNLQLWVNSDED